MEYILLTSRGCNRCDLAKHLLQEKGFKYKEVDAMTSEGIDLVLKYGSQTMPAIIDEEKKMVFSISDFNRYLEMINNEY